MGALVVSAVVLAGVSSVQAECPPHWTTEFETFECLPSWTHAFCSAVYDDGTGPVLYVGGNFAGVRASGFDVQAYSIARYSPESGWSAISPHAMIQQNSLSNPGSVFTMCVFQGKLYIAGRFGSVTQPGGELLDVRNLVVWDGAVFSSVGSIDDLTGQQHGIYDMAVYDDGNGPRLYIVGDFQRVNDRVVSFIASWDGQEWRYPFTGCGVPRECHAACVFNDGTGDALYVTGEFSSACRAPNTNGVFKWNGSVISGLPGVDGRMSRHLVGLNEPSGKALYLASGTGLIRWDGTGASTVPFPPNSLYSNNILFSRPAAFNDGAGEALYIAGRVVQCEAPLTNCGVVSDGLRKWDGSAWSEVLGGLIPDPGWVGAVQETDVPVFSCLSYVEAGLPKMLVTGKFAGARQTGGVASVGGADLVALAAGEPGFSLQPAGVNAPSGTPVSFHVGAFASSALSHQWRHNGQPLADSPNITGSLTDTLSIAHAGAGDAGGYDCVVSSSSGCGQATSAAATLTITDACAADHDHAGGVDVQDVFAFLNDWFQGFPAADFNHSGDVSVSDIFDFLTAWFQGC